MRGYLFYGPVVLMDCDYMSNDTVVSRICKTVSKPSRLTQLIKSSTKYSELNSEVYFVNEIFCSAIEIISSHEQA